MNYLVILVVIVLGSHIIIITNEMCDLDTIINNAVELGRPTVD